MKHGDKLLINKTKLINNYRKINLNKKQTINLIMQDFVTYHSERNWPVNEFNSNKLIRVCTNGGGYLEIPDNWILNKESFSHPHTNIFK